jgi:hypothetical protein
MKSAQFNERKGWRARRTAVLFWGFLFSGRKVRMEGAAVAPGGPNRRIPDGRYAAALIHALRWDNHGQ